MKLIINGDISSLGHEFSRWLTKRLVQRYQQTVDVRKLEPWDNYISTSEDFVKLYKTPIKSYNILLTGIKNLQYDSLPDKLIVRFNNNMFMPGLDRTKVDTLCRLITFGNNSIKGYPILKDLLDETVNNIDAYIDSYLEGF